MRSVLHQLGRYKKDTGLCVVLTTLEVIMEILLPFITARLLAEGLEASNLSAVYRYGAILVVMSLLSLIFGATAGRFAASAASGFAANLREAIYAQIQTFSFSNIDKFSVPGLVTRMTTDITNVQQAFMMVIRIAVRSPLTLIFSFGMCMYINVELSLTFLIALGFLVAVIGTIMVITLRIFNQVFRKYDDLNASVQENVSAIRVVKAFVREGYEDSKFAKASKSLYDLSVKAEGLLAFNGPSMMIAVYFCIIMVSWLGAHFIVVDGTLGTTDLTSLYSYIMSLLMSLMMLSMVVVMISMSMASIRRIDDVLRESPDLAEPEQPVTVDVRRYDMEALRNQVSVVLQKNPLFSGTILDNLRWGSPEATREECVQACRAACADEFIDRLPDGYDIYIERGTHDQLMEKKGTYYQLYTGQPARQVG